VDAFRAFQVYTSVRLHFSQDSYDLFKAAGKLRGTLKAFEKRKDTKIFYGWAKNYEAPNFINLVAANCMYGFPDCAYDRETAERNYREYEKRRQSITKVFADDIDRLENLDNQTLIQKMLGGRITIETCVILHKVLGMFQKDLPAVLEPAAKRIKKANRFVRYSRERIERVLEERGHMNKEVE